MKDYIIISDSTCDLTKEITNKYSVDIMPLTVIMDKKENSYSFLNSDFNLPEFYEKMKDGMVATTAQINVVDAEKFFRKYIEKNMNILYICFSSGLSGTYNSTCLAANNLMEEFPDNKIIVVDSLCASAGEGLLVVEAAKNKEKGLSLEENAKAMEDLKLKVNHWFTVETVEYLRRGGRLSNTKAFVAKVFGIKPVLDVDNDGHLQARATVHGRNQSLKALIDRTMEAIDKDYQFTTIICHASCEDDALRVKAELEKKYQENSINSEIILTPMGPVIGAHAGPGTVALFTICSARV